MPTFFQTMKAEISVHIGFVSFYTVVTTNGNIFNYMPEAGD